MAGRGLGRLCKLWWSSSVLPGHKFQSHPGHGPGVPPGRLIGFESRRQRPAGHTHGSQAAAGCSPAGLLRRRADADASPCTHARTRTHAHAHARTNMQFRTALVRGLLGGTHKKPDKPCSAALIPVALNKDSALEERGSRARRSNLLHILACQSSRVLPISCAGFKRW